MRPLFAMIALALLIASPTAVSAGEAESKDRAPKAELAEQIEAIGHGVAMQARGAEGVNLTITPLKLILRISF